MKRAEIGSNVDRAAELLRAGELVAIPTETVYGLAGNGLDEATIAHIFATKGRPHFDPLILHLHATSALDRYVTSIPGWAAALASAFWPGPLTLVLNKRDVVPDLATAGLPTIAMRVPNHPMTLALLAELSFPLAAPSANPFGYVSPTTPEHVLDQLGPRIEYVLDGGPCRIGIESTIVGEVEGQPTVFRLGGISLESLRHVLPDLQRSKENSIVAPGMMKSHYAPHVKLVLGEPEEAQSNFAALRFSETLPDISLNHQIVLSPSGDLHEAAANLFAALRQLDTMPGIDVAYAELVPDIELGRAINDRLKRAAFPIDLQ